MPKAARLILVVTAVVLVTACSGNETPTSPGTIGGNVSPGGRWAGPITDSISGEGTLQLSLDEQAPNSFAGTWSMTFKNGESFTGPATAGLFTPTGYGVIMSVAPAPSCAGTASSAPIGFTLINVAVTSSRLTAVAGRTSCNGPSFGSISLSRQ